MSARVPATAATVPPPMEIQPMSRPSESKYYRKSREKAAELLTKVLHQLDGWKFIMEVRQFNSRPVKRY